VFGESTKITKKHLPARYKAGERDRLASRIRSVLDQRFEYPIWFSLFLVYDIQIKVTLSSLPCKAKTYPIRVFHLVRVLFPTSG